MLIEIIWEEEMLSRFNLCSTQLKNRMLLTASALSIITSITPTFAQETDNEDENGVDTIVVTSTKRPGIQSLQDTAASIAAMGQDTLEKMGAVEFTDFSRSIVGLDAVDTGPGQKRYLIRGVNAPGEATVGLYIDNMPLTGGGESSRTQGDGQPDYDLFDVRQVEVLRGPQGTLYGSSSVSGIVRVVTNKPIYNEYDTHFQAGYGTTKNGSGSWTVKGMANLPVVDDKLALRAVGYQSKTGGFVDSAVIKDRDGNLLQKINDHNRAGFRLGAKFQLAENTRVLAQWFYQDVHSGARNSHNPYDSTEHIGPPFIAIDNGDGTYTRSNDFSVPAAGILKSNTDSREPYDENLQNFGLTAIHEVDEIGEFNFSYSLQDRSVDRLLDSSPPHDLLTRFGNCVNAGCPSAGFTYFSPAYGASLAINEGLFSPTGNVVLNGNFGTTMHTGEARFATTWEEKLNFVGGVFYQHRKQTVDNKLYHTLEGGLPNYGGPILLDRYAKNTTKQMAVFGEVYYNVTEKLELMAGLRWFNTKRDQLSVIKTPFLTSFVTPQCDADGDGFISHGNPGGVPPIPNPTHPVTGDPIVFNYGDNSCYPLTEQNTPGSEDDLIKKAQVTYHMTDDVKLFATYAEGFRAGGANAVILTGIPPFFGHDETKEYSLGFKSQWADRRLTFNASLYQIDWYGQQTPVAITTQFSALTETKTPNGGPVSRSRGLEIELGARPTDNLDLGFNITFLKTELLVNLIDVVPADLLTASSEDFPVRGEMGQRLLGSPRNSGSAFAQYSWNVNDTMDAYIRGDLQFQSEIPLNSYHPERNLPNQAYIFGNLRAGIATEKYAISIYVKNITDEVADLFIANNLQSQNRVTVNAPRTIGFTLDIKM